MKLPEGTGSIINEMTTKNKGIKIIDALLGLGKGDKILNFNARLPLLPFFFLHRWNTGPHRRP